MLRNRACRSADQAQRRLPELPFCHGKSCWAGRECDGHDPDGPQPQRPGVHPQGLHDFSRHYGEEARLRHHFKRNAPQGIQGERYRLYLIKDIF